VGPDDFEGLDGVIGLFKFPILKWEDRLEADSKHAMIRVPYKDMDEIVEELSDLGPYMNLLPPYKEDAKFNARTGSVLWDKFPKATIFMPVPTANRKLLEDFVTMSIKEGWRAFAVPERYGYNQKYRFDQLLQFLHGSLTDDMWFHVAGGPPELPEDIQGKWSWSEEVL
jgi:hypothetical protein